MAVLEHHPTSGLFRGGNVVLSSLGLTTTEREGLALLFKLLLHFHDVHHGICAGRQHNNDRSRVPRVVDDLEHVEGRRNDVLLAQFFFQRDQLLDHVDDLVRPDQTHHNGLVQDGQLVPLPGPDVLVTLRLVAVVDGLPDLDVLLEVGVEAMESRQSPGQLHDTAPGLVRQPRVFSGGVLSIHVDTCTSCHEVTNLWNVEASSRLLNFIHNLEADQKREE